MMSAEVLIQVQFYDTDSLGIIYYGSYYRYFEAGFLKLLKNAGLSFSEIHKRGIYLPATLSSCNYYSPSTVEESLKIATTIHSLGYASVAFKHEVFNMDRKGKLVAQGHTRHACVSTDWRVTPLPDWLKSALQGSSKSKG
ncbi:MAG: acyl-CoA thioesterase [Elusimicrobia bacterium]|nr:acyl-CoA thioesterase [Elusimicrobiota bacterium]